MKKTFQQFAPPNWRINAKHAHAGEFREHNQKSGVEINRAAGTGNFSAGMKTAEIRWNLESRALGGRSVMTCWRIRLIGACNSLSLTIVKFVSSLSSQIDDDGFHLS